MVLSSFGQSKACATAGTFLPQSQPIKLVVFLGGSQLCHWAQKQVPVEEFLVFMLADGNRVHCPGQRKHSQSWHLLVNTSAALSTEGKQYWEVKGKTLDVTVASGSRRLNAKHQILSRFVYYKCMRRCVWKNTFPPKNQRERLLDWWAFSILWITYSFFLLPSQSCSLLVEKEKNERLTTL